MKLRTQLTDEIEKKLTSEDVLARCEIAKKFEEAGDYEAAIAAMGQLWAGQDLPEALEILDERANAELLLRQGVLTGWMGSTKQIEGSQDHAKDLLSKSITIFEGLRDATKIAEAETELAYCYWRQGAFDEARTLLDVALSRLPDNERYQRARIYLRRALLESSATRLNDALRVLRDARPLFEVSNSHALQGKFHNELALVLKNLAAAEQRDDYIDLALIEFAAASFHFEQAAHIRYQGCVENNLGFLFLKLGRFNKAHEHLERARRLAFEAHDYGHLAQFNETMSRLLLAEGRYEEAERVARSVVKTFERGGEQSLLSEALTTHATALARIGKRSKSRAELERAIAVAENSGDLASAGRARLCLIEELGHEIPIQELIGIYQAAADLLEPSQDPATRKQLSSCTRKILDALNNELNHRSQIDDSSEQEATKTWEGFSFRSEVIRYEQLLIERALRDAGGVVSRAAQFLGFKHHQSLISLLNTRHKTLIQARSPVRPRRHSIMSARRKARRSARRAFTVNESHAESVT